ncbi:SHOCT domain-containing protein [Acidisoma cellulosilytica]|uniref:SHOCT domain-containing protein n=1 Tax=Acidisoma cellulosilyticum TaxID=2802395 RepID=A0A963Z3X7_9PROT|nr:SHOCT domain-containing protein [Acidisoma cellulosilyticum]MCB8882322.1 SHOCT domain-containing protein [Acidisoma cellulosilyticum]
MHQSDLDALQRLHNLKSRGVLTEYEYERKKIEILSQETSSRGLSAQTPNPRLGQGVSLLIGAVILFLISVGLLSPDHVSQDDLQTALGMIILFCLWLIPHSIWLLSRAGANVILPIIALVLTGLSGLVYMGSL